VGCSAIGKNLMLVKNGLQFCIPPQNVVLINDKAAYNHVLLIMKHLPFIVFAYKMGVIKLIYKG
jgi:hypothetical protein